MAQLEKFIKVTQEQYNTLQAGGTVGSHTGINPNFIYLVENNGSDTPSSGGTTVIAKDIYMSDCVEDSWRWGGNIEITSDESALLTDPNSQVVVRINILDDDDDLIYVDYLYKASQFSMLMNMTYYTNNMSAMSAYDVSGTEVISLVAVFQGRDYLTYMMCNKSMMYGNHEVKLDESIMTNNQFQLQDSIYHAALSGFPVKIGDLYLRLTYVNADGTFGLSSYDTENDSWLNFKMTAAPTISVDGNISATFALDPNDTENPYSIGISTGGDGTTVIPNPTLSGSETVLTGLTIDGTNYRMPEVTVDETYVADALSNFLADEIEPKLEDKQDTLVSGTNIKTINGTSILGSGNISIEGGSGSGTSVEANPTDLATDVLAKLKVAGVTYSLPSSGGSGGTDSKLVIQKTTALTDYSFEDVTFTVEEFTQLFESNNCELRITTPNDVLIMTKSQLIDLDGAYGVSFESSHLSLSMFGGVGFILTLASDMSTGVEILPTAISGNGGSGDSLTEDDVNDLIDNKITVTVVGDVIDLTIN